MSVNNNLNNSLLSPPNFRSGLITQINESEDQSLIYSKGLEKLLEKDQNLVTERLNSINK